MFNLSPKNDKFFELFEKQATIIESSAKALGEFIKNPVNAMDQFNKIKDIEHEGDKALHAVFQELNNSFITPIDREDIYSIGKALDDVTDFIEATASKFVIFNLSTTMPYAVDMAALVTKSAGRIVGLINEFKNMKNNKTLTEHIVELNTIENEGDVSYRKAVRELFSNEKYSTLDIIIWKEIYESIESILDACEDVANIIEGVVMKNA